MMPQALPQVAAGSARELLKMCLERRHQSIEPQAGPDEVFERVCGPNVFDTQRRMGTPRLTARSTSRRISCEAYGVSRLHRTFAHKTTPAMKTAPSQLLRFACACRSAPTLVLRFHCRDFA